MKKMLFVSILVALVALIAVACAAPAPTATPVPPTAAPAKPTDVPKPTAAPAQPTAAPKPTEAPKPTVAPTAVPKPTEAPKPTAMPLTKFPFRLNWTLYGEHAAFFVAREKGFYAEEGLDVEIQEGGGSGVVAGLVANNQSPVAYIDSATMIQRVVGGMPIKAVAVMLQQSPMAFIYRADAARPTKVSEIKGSRIAITQGDASLAIFTAFLGKEGMKLDDVQFVMTANPQAKEQAVLNKQADALLGYFMDQGPRMQLQTGVKMGWTRLTDLNGTTALSSAVVVNNEWVKDAKNQDVLRRFLRASQRGWQYTADNRAEAAKIFIKYAPAFTEEIARLEIDGTMTILQSPRTKGKALGVSDEADWKDSQDLLAKFAEMKDPKPDVKVFFDNSFLSEAPYLPKK